MKKAFVAFLAGLCAFAAWALEYKTVDIRRTGSSPVRETFWTGDSIAFGYALEEDGDYYDLGGWDMVTWEICTYTNPAQCWMGVTGRVDDAESGELSVETALPLSVVPEGQYRGYIKGLKVTSSNTVSSQRVLVEQVVTVRYGQTEFPPDVEDNGDIIEGNAYARQSALDAEAAARMRADTIMSNAIAVISSQVGGVVGVDTNAIVAAAVEAGATNFYGLGATMFGEASTNHLDFGHQAYSVGVGIGAEKVYVGMYADKSEVYATKLVLNNEPLEAWNELAPPEDTCDVAPFVIPWVRYSTHIFSTSNFWAQQLEVGVAGGSIEFEKADPAPFSVMWARMNLHGNGATIRTNNLVGFDANKVPSSGWFWMQLESYPSSTNFAVVDIRVEE